MNMNQRIDANIDLFLKSTGADPQRIRIQYGEAKVEKCARPCANHERFIYQRVKRPS